MELNANFQVEEDMTITIAVHPLDTIREVKKKIQTTFGIPISRQIIILDNGQFLQDHVYVLNSRICYPSSRFLFSVQPNAQNIVSPPLPSLCNRMLPSSPQPTLFHPLELITHTIPPTTPLVPMLPGHQVSIPASTPVAQGPAITPISHSPEFAPLDQVPARTLMGQAPERTQAIEVPASTMVAPAPATERTLVCPMPPWKPVVRMHTGTPVLPMQLIQSNIELEDSAPNTERDASSVKVIVNVGKPIPIKTEWDSTVLMLKQKIVEYLKICARNAGSSDMEDVTVERMVLQSHFTDATLRDDVLLKHCLSSLYPEVDLCLETVGSSDS
ncbi:hypothetical protein LR48_Vigan02g230500 [Vigna angularis]|uniref:Ubiquitin-like domain-containing protein n=1 Tax=Phaseolus angularis TaxID=3914 RepID=A0A0L9U037_PHAAN|nr:hypothetical protein LR48_Vigan02g230500 [Vigna angularis]